MPLSPLHHTTSLGMQHDGIHGSASPPLHLRDFHGQAVENAFTKIRGFRFFD